MQTVTGRRATKRMVSARSSDCSMRALSSAVTGTGRLSRIGVATSPGQMQQALQPLARNFLGALYHPAAVNYWL